jgi:hypothetical protein
MKRVALIAAIVGLFCVAVGQAQAHHPYYKHPGYYHHGEVVVRQPVVVNRPVMVIEQMPPPPPPCYYYYGPARGFYYQGRGLSIGVGF